MSSLQDPFYVAKEDIIQSSRQVNALFDRWKDLLHSTNTANSEEFQWTSSELQNEIKSLDWDLSDLEATINKVEANRQKFKIEESELQTRKQFISEQKRKVQEWKDEMVKTKGKVEKDQRELLMKQKKPQSNKYAKLEAAVEADNESFVSGQKQMHEEIIKDQDEDLQKISVSIGNIKTMGDQMSNTLKEHDEILDDLNKGSEKANSSLKQVTKKVNDVLDSMNEKTQWCVIVALLLVLVGLVVLVFYL